jgi:hypothetical protein
MVSAQAARGGAGGRGRGGRRGPGQRPQPYNRDKFLQANFRFLVSDAADLRRAAADADLMLDWDDVVEVRGACFGVWGPRSLFWHVGVP